jgi:hypothetical protein
MAERKATLILELKDLASKGMGAVESGLGKLKANFLAVSAAVAGLTAFLASSVKAYLDQENANERLNQSLKNQGIYTKQTATELQAYAGQLQRTTTFTDEAIVESMALLTTFGLSGDKLKETTKLALDFSTSLGVDLHTASILLGKAFQGQTESLGRYGIKIDENIPKSERFTAVMDALNQRFGGSAEARLNTMSGRLENFGHRVDELKEKIGGLLIPVLDFFLGKILTILDAVEEIANSTASLQRFAATAGQIFLELGKMIADVFIASFEHLSPLFKLVGVDLDELKTKTEETFNELSGQLEQWANDAEISAQRRGAADDVALSRKKQVSIAERQLIQQQKAEEEKAALDKAAFLAKLDLKIRDEKLAFLNDQAAWQKKLTEEDRQEQERRIRNAESALNFISSLSYAKNKELAAIGKAAAISVATVDTYQAANKALASAPPPWNFALAAAVVAAGLSNVSRIVGVQMAEGGLVMPTNGGTMATIGEAGRAEAVIPLDDPRTREKLAGSGLGSNVTVNVGVLVGSDGMREFTRIIDEHLFELERTGQRVSS